MVIVIAPRLYARATHLANLVVVEVDELDQRVLQKQANEFDRGRLIVGRFVPIRAARVLMFPMPNFRSSMACHSRSTQKMTDNMLGWAYCAKWPVPGTPFTLPYT